MWQFQWLNVIHKQQRLLEWNLVAKLSTLHSPHGICFRRLLMEPSFSQLYLKYIQFLFNGVFKYFGAFWSNNIIMTSNVCWSWRTVNVLSLWVAVGGEDRERTKERWGQRWSQQLWKEGMLPVPSHRPLRLKVPFIHLILMRKPENIG